MVANHLSMGNQEQNAIHQKAYLSILGGESIQNVRFRYDYDWSNIWKSICGTDIKTAPGASMVSWRPGAVFM